MHVTIEKGSKGSDLGQGEYNTLLAYSTQIMSHKDKKLGLHKNQSGSLIQVIDQKTQKLGMGKR